MENSHWVRVFKIPYRKHGDLLVRETNVACETVKSGMYRPGDKTFIDTPTHVTVHVFIPYFEEPRTEEEQEKVDRLFGQCEQEADQYVKANYPDATVTGEG